MTGSASTLVGVRSVSLLWARPSLGMGVPGEGGQSRFGPGRRIIIHFPAFLRMIGSWGCLITRKNAGIVPLALYESQMGGRNHMYFTHDGALRRFHAHLGWL